MSAQRHTLIPAVFVVFKKEDHILLMRRFNTGYADGFLTPPAGHVEAGEKFSQTAVRESLEEVGLTLQPQDLVPFHIIQRRVGNQPERIDVYFLATKWVGDPAINEPDKCSELLWAPISNLPQDTIFACRHAIEHGVQGVVYSELWEK